MNVKEQDGIYNDKDKDISLKALILNLWFGKWIISIITVICLVLGAVYTFVIADKLYESRATVSAKPEIELGYTMDVYAELIKSPILMDMVATYLEIEISTGALSQMTSAKVISNTDMIEIVVKNEDPDTAKDIADAIAQSYIEYMPQQIQAKAKEEADLIQIQIDDNLDRIGKLNASLTRIYKQNECLYNLENEIEKLRCQLTDYQVQTISDKNELILEQLYLAELNRMTEDIRGLGETNIIDGGFKQETLMTKIAETEAKVVRLESNLSLIPEFVQKLEALIKEKEALYNDYKYRIDSIKTSLSFRGETNEELYWPLNRANLKTDSNYGLNDFSIVSDASLPVSPIKLNNKMNLLIALVIGIVLGGAVVMFRVYILDIKSKQQKVKSGK